MILSTEPANHGALDLFSVYWTKLHINTDVDGTLSGASLAGMWLLTANKSNYLPAISVQSV